MVFFAHRACTALRAALLRSSAVMAAALAGPPFLPPLRPRATAAGFFFFVMLDNIRERPRKNKLTIRERSRIVALMMTTREQRAFDIANRFPITTKNLSFAPIQVNNNFL